VNESIISGDSKNLTADNHKLPEYNTGNAFSETRLPRNNLTTFEKKETKKRT